MLPIPGKTLQRDFYFSKDIAFTNKFLRFRTTRRSILLTHPQTVVVFLLVVERTVTYTRRVRLVRHVGELRDALQLLVLSAARQKTMHACVRA